MWSGRICCSLLECISRLSSLVEKREDAEGDKVNGGRIRQPYVGTLKESREQENELLHSSI